MLRILFPPTTPMLAEQQPCGARKAPSQGRFHKETPEHVGVSRTQLRAHTASKRHSPLAEAIVIPAD
jgi:hypothetical protein